MSSSFRLALGWSVALHAGLFVGLPVTAPVTFDIERAPTSVELVLMPPSQPIPQAAPTVEPEPAPQPVMAPEQKGAETDVQPDYLRNPPPVYPRAAREQGEEGTVLLEVGVLASGRCGSVRALASSGHPLLDEAAVRAVRQWVFRPARRFNQPVPFVVEIPITFRLIDADRSMGGGGI